MTPATKYQVTAVRVPASRLHSLSDSSVDGTDEDENGPSGPTPLERLTTAMCKNDKTIKDLIVGRRVGFYKVHREIGHGTFSRVKLATHSLTKDKVAIKVLEKARLDMRAQRLLYREISSMEALQHPNVVHLYEVLETPSRLFLVLEYAGGGDLQDHIYRKGKLSDHESKITFAQILFAIRHLHQNNIIHRDLKAENVLYASNACVKVADFGFSTRVPNHTALLNTFCGSPPYAAPELFKDDQYIGPPVDIWAMGVLLFFMVTGTMPFRAETMGKLRRCIMDGVYTIPDAVPGPCSRLIAGILKHKPADRYPLDQMLGCDWLLPVESSWSLALPVQPSPTRLLEDGELTEEEEEAKALMEQLGITTEHIVKATTSRSPITGVYRILLHAAMKRKGCDAVPVVKGVERDVKRDGLRAYRGLKHVSNFCVLS